MLVFKTTAIYLSSALHCCCTTLGKNHKLLAILSKLFHLPFPICCKNNNKNKDLLPLLVHSSSAVTVTPLQSKRMNQAAIIRSVNKHNNSKDCLKCINPKEVNFPSLFPQVEKDQCHQGKLCSSTH